ncbi:flavin reductase family protein [Salinibacterium sp. SYSU T00001]|uniref:flavin reductase family protein n=1 Tax=Homoserinimonas sedimenticola TaxID=2986805 RepID=UPI002235D01E|nr:flavin reductase family protein [Salinibacterium sedimenticola]MCW4384963.1 flavin reductase family protein [Salinibacterium sedimenticola]
MTQYSASRTHSVGAHAVSRITGARHGEVGELAASDGLSAEEFKAVFRNHPAGVAVITADAGEGPVGLTATSVFSVSAEPPLLVFSVSSQSSATPTILRADTLVVHLLGVDQLDLARLCSTSGIDRFADRSRWDRLITGEPYYLGTDSWIRGRVVQHMEAGNSTVIAVHALQSHRAEEPSAPLVYHNRTWHGLGDHSTV